MKLLQRFKNTFTAGKNLYKIYKNKNTILKNVGDNYSFKRAFNTIKNLQDTIPEKVKARAQLAEASYKDIKDRPEQVKGYQRISQLDDDRLAVYKKGNKLLFSHRGTSPKSLTDLTDDTFIANNDFINSDRYKKTKKQVEGIMNQYKDHKFSHIGHSLGGMTAKQMGIDFGHKSYGFNSGTSTTKINAPKHKENTILGDVISNSQLFQDHGGRLNVYKPQVGFNTHSLQNFLQ
eukprot:Pgem_evm12s8721